MRYLNGSKENKLILKPGEDNQLSASIDSNWGSKPSEGSRSRNGIIIRYGNALIYATSSLQECVSISSTEAEYVALSEGCKVIAWLRQVLSEFNIVQDGTKVFQDNKGAIDWVNGGPAKHFSRRKHVDIRYHYVTEMVYNGQIEVVKTPTARMDADFLTKPLGPLPFSNNMRRLKLFQ